MSFTLNKSSLLLYFLVISSFIVYGCSSSAYVPVEQRANDKIFYKNNAKGFNKNNKITYHYVRKKDTLYSIAWQYGLDFKDLARWNNIKAPFLIKIGQRVRLSSKYTKKSTGRIKSSSKKLIKKKYNYQKKTSKNKTQAKYKTKQTKLTKKSHKKAPLYKNRLNWVWPAKGRVIQSFSPSKGKKGIDISASKGSKIRAAESGKVVYSGHGLTGYGLLLIIKHNSHYLSAYAHNSKLLIKEGSKVKRNQTIALAGKTASERVKLHFEIRKNGKPVNPLKYLPKK